MRLVLLARKAAKPCMGQLAEALSLERYLRLLHYACAPRERNLAALRRTRLYSLSVDIVLRSVISDAALRVLGQSSWSGKVQSSSSKPACTANWQVGLEVTDPIFLFRHFLPSF